MEVYLIIEMHLVFQICVGTKKNALCHIKTEVKAAINLGYCYSVKSLILIRRMLIFIKY